MAEKNTSKRPSVVGRKMKAPNASVPSASAGKSEGLFQDSSKGAGASYAASFYSRGQEG